MSAPRGTVLLVSVLADSFGKLCFVDVETTGLDANRDELIEVGAVFVEDGDVTERKRWLLKPTTHVPPMVQALTGLNDATLANAPRFVDLEPEIRAALSGWTLVAHNAHFERSFLRETISSNPVLDSCEVAQLLFPLAPSHSLDSLIKWLGTGTAARHRAIDDAEDTFEMLLALVLRFANEGTHAQLEAIRAQLAPGALRSFIETLQPPLPKTRITVPLKDGSQLVRWLNAPQFVSAELEDEPLAELALGALRDSREPLVVAVPFPTFRELSARRDVPALARQPIDLLGLKEALQSRGDSEQSCFGRAYLASWLSRTPTGELGTLSGFVRSRLPEFEPLLTPLPTPQGDRVVISHEHALEWLASGNAAKFIFVDADRLPDTERRRLSQTLSLWELDQKPQLAAQTTALRTALAAQPEGALVSPAVREALRELRLAMGVSALVGESAPPPGFELVVRRDALTYAPIRPAERVARKLRPGIVLLSSFSGGTRWAHASALTSTIPLRSDVQRHSPVNVEQLPALLREMNADVLVAPGPLEPLVAALLQAGVAVSLGAMRDETIRVIEWRRDTQRINARSCVLFGVKDWRRAAKLVTAATLTTC
jgi:DNA polymerase III epsilon subunit family exonuclease